MNILAACAIIALIGCLTFFAIPRAWPLVLVIIAMTLLPFGLFYFVDDTEGQGLARVAKVVDGKLVYAEVGEQPSHATDGPAQTGNDEHRLFQEGWLDAMEVGGIQKLADIRDELEQTKSDLADKDIALARAEAANEQKELRVRDLKEQLVIAMKVPERQTQPPDDGWCQCTAQELREASSDAPVLSSSDVVTSWVVSKVVIECPLPCPPEPQIVLSDSRCPF